MKYSLSVWKPAFRTLGLVAGVLLFLCATESDCEAQLFRRHRLIRQNHAPGVLAGTKDRIQQSGLHRLIFGSSQHHRTPGFDPRTSYDADRYSRYPKFIGGFHSSQFSNLGVPNGDIGFRGNGVVWSPW